MLEVSEEDKAEQAKLPPGLPEIYVQLYNQCNSDPIAKLLDEAKAVHKKANREIHKPGAKVDRVLELKKAVDAGYINTKRIHWLIRRSEETGEQHIFLYRARSKIAREVLRDASQVATRLFDEAWGPEYFPVFTQPRESLAFVDFRRKFKGKPRDWILKAYGHGTKYKLLEKTKKIIDERTFEEIRRVTEEEVRTVMVARWRDPDVLEIRIDRTKSSGEKDIASRLGAFMALLAPAITSGQLTSFQLFDAGEKLILERKDKHGTPNPAYRLNSLTLMDQADGDVIFKPKEADDTFDDDEGRTKALEAALGGGAHAVGLSVTWLPCDQAPRSLVQPVMTTITGAACNELVFSAKIEPEVYDYILRRLTGN